MPRMARHFLLLHPSDCVQPHGLDLTPGSRDWIKVQFLADEFRRNGFDPKMPALVGYPDGNGMIQLLSGTHRHTAAGIVDIFLPVKIFLRSNVEAAWGLDDWAKVIADIPVEALAWSPVQLPSPPPGLDERIDLTRDLEETKILTSSRKQSNETC